MLTLILVVREEKYFHNFIAESRLFNIILKNAYSFSQWSIILIF